MKRIVLCAWLILVLSSFALSQPPDTLWTKTWDFEDSRDHLYSIRPTDDGGLILCGTTDFGPGARNGWVMRTDSDGNEIWSQLNSGGVSESADYIEQTYDGGFIECGETLSYSPYNDWDGYVRKLDADGNQIWARVFGADGWLDYMLCVREVPSGGYVAFGEIEDHITVVRLGPNGGTMWTRSFPPWFADDANFIEPTQDGGFLIAVDYYSSHFIIAKLSSTGTLIWTRDLMEEYGGNAQCVREMPDLTIAACGYVGVGNDGGAFYTVRLDADGELIWDDVIDRVNSQRAYELCVTPDNGIVVCGRSQDPDWYNYFLVKYDIDGNQLWELSIPGGDSPSQSICQTRDGGYVFGGGYGDVDLGEALFFHIIKTYPEVTVELTPEATLFPSTGGTLVFNEVMDNILIAPTDFDCWILVLGPDDFVQAYPPATVTLQPGETVTNENEQLVIPADWPDGEYTVELHYGVYPDPMANMGLGTIQIQKGEGSVDDPGTPGSQDDPGHPDQFTISEPWPNPFNAATTLSVELASPSDLHVTVYNMAGQQVATLANGPFAAGAHELTFNASNLASGLYFVRATVKPGLYDTPARPTSATRKVLLVR